MINEINKLAKAFGEIYDGVQQQSPLIHCITHGITMNDSANLILAVGAVPNMASHPREVVEVGRAAQALVINLGNISEERMEAMGLAARDAHEQGIPMLIDLVGVGCSTLRRDFAAELISSCHPQIIKGNSSEIRAICGLASHAVGVDAGMADTVTESNFAQAVCDIAPYAQKNKTVLLMSGPVDVITDGTKSCGVANGTAQLGRLTGTGCMLGALGGVFLSSRRPWEAAAMAAVMMGIAGERAQHVAGRRMGTFHVALLDAFSEMTALDIVENMRILY